jgi:hypothetical protein
VQSAFQGDGRFDHRPEHLHPSCRRRHAPASHTHALTVRSAGARERAG